MMVIILLFLPRQIVGYCFLGFAIGESLGASALRIAGGIFTKIADIGADLMKIVFKVKEDDPRNPGVIADCTGDNAGDSVGPTADGFETYGVTGVALISFITLALTKGVAENYEELQVKLIVWIFAMRFLMDFMSGCSYFINEAISKAKYAGLKTFDFEQPLTRLIWIAAILCISTSFGMSRLLIGDISVTHAGGQVIALPDLWWQLATIISCGTLAAVLIPEFTKVFTSSHSKHVHEIVTASREGGASLTILSGLVAGNFSAFWKGLLIAGLMAVAYFVSGHELHHMLGATAATFTFGLVAFGFLCMGPVNIAVDSYGPVTDNAQSVFELAQTEHLPGIKEEIKKDFGFEPDFEGGKHYLEANDSAGNTFKATAKPVLIGTAVVGATTMIFSIILILSRTIIDGRALLALSLTDAPVLLGFICGGSVIYWFSGASMQAVTTGAYRAVEFIKKNMDLQKTEADIEDSKTVVKICTQYAQSGMWNIFIALMSGDRGARLRLALVLRDEDSQEGNGAQRSALGRGHDHPSPARAARRGGLRREEGEGDHRPRREEGHLDLRLLHRLLHLQRAPGPGDRGGPEDAAQGPGQARAGRRGPGGRPLGAPGFRRHRAAHLPRVAARILRHRGPLGRREAGPLEKGLQEGLR
jgi:K(+)-stimulated pyrophosphate-energized sodium pump